MCVTNDKKCDECTEQCELKDCVHYYCDICGKETKTYKYKDQDVCVDCIANKIISDNSIVLESKS